MYIYPNYQVVSGENPENPLRLVSCFHQVVNTDHQRQTETRTIRIRQAYMCKNTTSEAESMTVRKELEEIRYEPRVTRSGAKNIALRTTKHKKKWSLKTYATGHTNCAEKSNTKTKLLMPNATEQMKCSG